MTHLDVKRSAAWLWACLITLAAGPLSTSTAQPRPPNIVIILADDLGIGDVGSYNSQSKAPTPHIDRLAAEGIRFTDAHAPGSWCTPTRYGLLTGRYPFRDTMRAWTERALIAPEQMTLASLLKENGYATAMVGKWHLGFEGGLDFDCTQPLRGGPIDHGFDRFFGMHTSLDIPPYFYIEGDRCVAAPTRTIEGHYSEDPFWTPIQGAFWRGGPIAPGFRHEDVLPRFREQAVAFLEEHDRTRPTEPFFLYLALTAPHTPWLPLEPFRGVSGAGIYGDFVAQVDGVVGEVLATLDRLGLTGSTLVFFTSDNGPVWYDKDEERFDHRATDVYRGMKGDAWEGGHRMPFIARWPGNIPPGAVSEETICFTDLLATFAAILGRSLPEDAGEDSYNILPAVLGKRHERPIREATVHDAVRYLAIRQGTWKLIPGLGSGGFSEPRTRDPGPGEPEGQLYNLEVDPRERNNLYGEHPHLVERLSELLEQYKEQGHSRSRPGQRR